MRETRYPEIIETLERKLTEREHTKARLGQLEREITQLKLELSQRLDQPAEQVKHG